LPSESSESMPYLPVNAIVPKSVGATFMMMPTIENST
jgi:hypothetical protein